MIELSSDQVRQIRLRAQCLHPRQPGHKLLDVVRAVGGAQAQLSPAMMLALRARVKGLTVVDVEEAISGSRRLVRTWAMRGTLHLLLAEDVRWLISLLGPIFVSKGKRRRLQLGLDEDLSARGLRAIRAILSNRGPLTRGELVEKLQEQGIALDRRSQAPIHLIGLAALQGVICLGPERSNGESTYALMDNWIAPHEPVPREHALAELARRYFAGYGPASVKDFAAWAGLSMTDARRGWSLIRDQGQLTEVHVEDRTLWLPTSERRNLSQFSRSEVVVRLLPAFDAYILGYADRDDLVPPKHQHQVYHGGQTVPAVLIDGLASGVWRYKRQDKRLQVAVHAFEPFDPVIQQQIAVEAEDIGRFWETSVSVSYSPNPL